MRPIRNGVVVGNMSFVVDNNYSIAPKGDKPWGFKRDNSLTLTINNDYHVFTPNGYLHAPGTFHTTYVFTGQNNVFAK
jgi:hypothetical protein